MTRGGWTGLHRGAAGMTLVELLIGIGILVVAGVWLLGAYHSALHLAEVAQQTTVALNDLRDMMERIKATPFAQLQADFPDGVADGPGGAQAYANVVGGYTLPAEQITITHSPGAAADPRELSAQVTWTNRGRVYQRRVATVRASQAG